MSGIFVSLSTDVPDPLLRLSAIQRATHEAKAMAEAVGARTLTEFSQFLPGGWSAQGGLSGSYFSPLRSRLIGEIGGFAGGSTHNNGARTGEILGNLRLHYEVGTGEIFGGAGAGKTSFGNGSQSIFIGEMGLSTRLGEIDATLTASPIAVDSIRYTDTQLALSWTRRSIVFDALFGFRLGDQLTDLGATARTWGSLSAIAWLTPHIAGVLSGGTYPIDPTQGFPGGRFLSASIRLARGNDRPDHRSAVSPDALRSLEAQSTVRFCQCVGCHCRGHCGRTRRRPVVRVPGGRHGDPAADERHDLPGEEQAVVGITQRPDHECEA